jgi:hypothetical protein
LDIRKLGGKAGHPTLSITQRICPRAWEQGESGKAIEESLRRAAQSHSHAKVIILRVVWAFRSYGCKITEKHDLLLHDIG